MFALRFGGRLLGGLLAMAVDSFITAMWGIRCFLFLDPQPHRGRQ